MNPYSVAERPGRRARLADREGERGVLDRLLDTVRAGESRVLVVRGEPGVGKTVLLDYLAGQAHGYRVARAAGVQSEMELAFAGLHQLCAPMLAGPPSTGVLRGAPLAPARARRVMAFHSRRGTALGAPAATAVVRQITLFPYPELPAYNGHGNIEDASSYVGRVSQALQQPAPWLGKFDATMIWCDNQGANAGRLAARQAKDSQANPGPRLATGGDPVMSQVPPVQVPHASVPSESSSAAKTRSGSR